MQSVFGGRLVWDDSLESATASALGSNTYDINETHLNWSEIRSGTGQPWPLGLSLIMIAVSTVGGYADGVAVSPRATASADTEALVLFTPTTTLENFPGLWLRGDGTFSGPIQSRNANCYWFEVDADGTNIQLVKSVAGSPTVLTTGAGSWTNGVDSWLRVAAIGNWFYAKAWAASSPEPSGWALQFSDLALSSGARFGLGLNGGPSAVDEFSTVFKRFRVWDLASPLGVLSGA